MTYSISDELRAMVDGYAKDESLAEHLTLGYCLVEECEECLDAYEDMTVEEREYNSEGAYVYDVQYMKTWYAGQQSDADTYVRLDLAIGGPSVWLDTRTRKVYGSWGAASCERGLRYSVSNAINEYYTEGLE